MIRNSGIQSLICSPEAFFIMFILQNLTRQIMWQFMDLDSKLTLLLQIKT